MHEYFKLLLILVCIINFMLLFIFGTASFIAIMLAGLVHKRRRWFWCGLIGTFLSIVGLPLFLLLAGV